MITFRSVCVWLVNAYFAGVIGYLLFRNSRIKEVTFITMPVLAFYLSFVAKITVFSRIPWHEPRYMLVPFWSYRAIAVGVEGIIPEVFWNVVLFIPIGILFMLFLTCKRKWVITVIIGFLLTTAIELIQLIFHRGYFEFDDIFHNTLGTVIGIGIYIIVVKLLSGFSFFKKVKE